MYKEKLLEKQGEKIYNKLVEIEAKKWVLSVKSDIRNSDTFGMLFKDIIRYVPQRRCWYYYDSVRWQMDEDDIVVSELCKILANQLKMYVLNEVPFDEQKQCMDNALRWQNYSYRKKIIDDARTVNTIPLTLFDSNEHLINCQNGTFDLKTCTLNPHNPDDLITKLAPVDIDVSVNNERWDSFILEIMSGDEQKAEYLQKVLGNALFGGNNEECLYILYGATTRNGKGTLVESILNVLGDYATTVRPESLAVSNRGAGSHSEDIARLKGVRFANISEPSKNMKFNASLVKSLTGGDTINARYLHENSFDFKPQMKIYINTNYLPSVNDNTVFKSNRMVVIPFDRHFEPYEQDKTLKSFFATDELKTAIMNWLICGYYMCLSNGLEQPDSVKIAITDYENKNDVIYNFLKNALVRYKEGKTPVMEAHNQYSNWARVNGYDQMSIVEFGRHVSKYEKVANARINGIQLRCIVD